MGPRAFSQARGQGRDRLGDGDAAGRDSTVVDPQPREARPEVVEAQASGGSFMTVPGTTAVVEEAGSTSEWLEAHCRGPLAPGDVILHAPSFAFQAPGGGENQLIQSGRHVEELGIPVRLFSRMDGPPGDGAAASSLRDVARGSRAGAGGQGAGYPGGSLADLLVRAAPMAALEPEPMREVASLAGWGLRSVLPGTPSWRLKLLKMADAVLPNSRCEANQLMRLFGVSRSGSAWCPTACCQRFARRSRTNFIADSGRFRSCSRWDGSSRGRIRWG